MKKLFSLLFFSAVAGAYADFSIQLDAGRLRVDASAPLPHVDNTSPSNGGSLLLLIAANGDGEFDNSIASGNYVAGNDLVLAAGGFNTSGGTDEAITFFYVSTNSLTLPGNDRIALRWFPQITFQDYKNGVTPTAGQTFGTYNPRTSNPPNASDNPDGGDPWLVPPGGAISLNFFTAESDLGGTQSIGEGYAQFVIGTNPSPTPTPALTPTPTSTPTTSPTPTATPAVTATATPTPTATAPATVTISGNVSYCAGSPRPVPDVTLNLTGGATTSTLSDGSGNYQFSSLPSGGSYIVTPTKSALAPGSAGINTVDVIATQRYFLNLGTPLSGCRLTAADVNGNTVIDTVDVIAIQRFFLGQTTGIANTGKYRFAPTSRAYPGMTSNQTGQNYDGLIFGDVTGTFADQPDTLPQSAADNGTSVVEVPATVEAVALPEVAVNASVSNFIAQVTTTAIDVEDNLVGFQGDFTFDESVVTFQSTPVARAGLTANGNWALAANVLGTGTIKTLRVSCFALDANSVLSGEGPLFELRMTRVSSKPGASTQLIWAAEPNNFLFLNDNVQWLAPAGTPPGSVTARPAIRRR